MTTQVITAGGASPFDIPALQKSITSVLATVPKDQWINLVFDVRKDKASAAVILRGGDHAQLLAWVTKPYASDWDYGLQGRVSFLVTETPRCVWFARLRGYYRLFRAEFMGDPLNDRDLAAWKALLSWLGFRVRLVG